MKRSKKARASKQEHELDNMKHKSSTINQVRGRKTNTERKHTYVH